jgi:hypothetical protein
MLVSCAVTEQIVQTVQEAGETLLVSNPERFPTFEVKPQKAKVTRAPASFKKSVKLKPEKDLVVLYFLSLYQQYQYFNMAVGKSEERLICPNFHNELLDYRHHELNVKEVGSAPFMKNHPLVDSSSAYVSFNKYNKVNQREIEELCHSGESDGLYRFLNLAKYYRNPKAFPVKTNPLVAFLKVPVVANIYFLNNLRATEKNLYMSPVESELLSQLNAHVVRDYLYGAYGQQYNGRKYSFNKEF